MIEKKLSVLPVQYDYFDYTYKDAQLSLTPKRARDLLYQMERLLATGTSLFGAYGLQAVEVFSNDITWLKYWSEDDDDPLRVHLDGTVARFQFTTVGSGEARISWRAHEDTDEEIYIETETVDRSELEALLVQYYFEQNKGQWRLPEGIWTAFCDFLKARGIAELFFENVADAITVIRTVDNQGETVDEPNYVGFHHNGYDTWQILRELGVLLGKDFPIALYPAGHVRLVSNNGTTLIAIGKVDDLLA